MMMVRLLHPEDLLNGNLRETQFMNISTKESYRVEYIPPMPCEQCMLESKLLLLVKECSTCLISVWWLFQQKVSSASRPIIRLVH